jgi:phosphonate degradation associated HDIG domain protein
MLNEMRTDRSSVIGEDRLEVVDEVFRLFERNGKNAYFGEPVSQEEHALQAAHLAEQAEASKAQVVVALLHDIGHLLHGLDERIAEQGVDGHHEAIGAAWLRKHFGPEVTEPAKLHVAAKRYLCAVESTYRDQLSPASVQSLHLQGGPFSAAEVQEFEANRYYREAVQLRKWDDEAKIPGFVVPDLEHYRPYLEATLAR